MSELGPRAREILHSGRELNRPTADDRERVDRALRERLGAALLLGTSSKALPTPRPRWPFLTTAAAGAGLIGVGLFFATQRPSANTAAPSPVVAAISAPSIALTAAAPVADLPAPAEAARPLPFAAPDRPAPLVAPSVRPAEDRLAQEVALLARATTNLHAGRAADALKVLDEYQRRFPKGMLTEERRAARAQTLCALGRQSEAQGELARLAPHSLAAARAKQACDAGAAQR